jgi:cyclophilin family peptidyl-prolyl cis-trans isomerase
MRSRPAKLSVGLFCAGLALLVGGSARANTLVDIQFNLGLQGPPFDTVRIELFDSAAPVTVANFLRYARDPGYENSIMHRLVPGFVLQGGGFTIESDGTEVTGLPPIATYPPIVNEFSPQRSNVRGTLAMAKLGGNPNSATSQWFFNLNNNAANLDNQNGGFTVFARVVDDGMTLIDAFATLSRYNLNPFYYPNYNPSFPNEGPFTDVPLLNGERFIVIEKLTVVGDADGNQVVNIDDYFRLERGRALGLSGFENGDFDGDGAVDADDYATIDRAFAARQSTGPAGLATPATVPEPGGVVLMVAAGLLTSLRLRGAGRARRQ